jgi:hypothetical protein
MLNPRLQSYAEQMVRGELPSLADEDVIAALYGLLTPDAQGRRFARVALRVVLNRVAPKPSTPVLVERR